MSESEATVAGPNPEPELPVSKFAEGYDPSNGGDIVLCSVDNIKFMVHSAFLRSVSPVLGSMIPPSKCDTQRPEIQLLQHSEVLTIILNFLTQRPGQPVINDFSSLSACLHASIMYKLCSVTTYLRSLLWTSANVHIVNFPIDVYNISTIYNFEHEKKLAFQQCIRTVDLRSPATVVYAISRCRDMAIVLQLVTRIARRTAIILETLSALHLFPMDLRSSLWVEHLPQWSLNEELVCDSCRTNTVFKTVSWQMFWVYFAKQELLKSSGLHCDHVFKVQFMCMPRNYRFPGSGDDSAEGARMSVHGGDCRECLELVVLDNASCWEEWASVVKSVLHERLGDDF